MASLIVHCILYAKYFTYIQSFVRLIALTLRASN